MKRAPGAKTPDLQCLALPGNRSTLAWEESGVIARLGASGDQWAVPRAQSRRTEPYWEPGEVEEEGVHSGGEVELLVVSREVKHHSMAKLSKSLWLATKGPTQREKTKPHLCAPSDPPLEPPLARRTATICIEPSLLRYSLQC